MNPSSYPWYKSFRLRAILFAQATCIIPVSLALFLFHTQAARIHREQAEKYYVYSISQAGAQIRTHMREYERVTRLAAQSQTVQDEYSSAHVQEKGVCLAPLLGDDRNVLAMAVYDLAGRRIASTNDRRGRRNISWANMVRSLGSYATDFYVDSQGDLCVDIGVMIYESPPAGSDESLSSVPQGIMVSTLTGATVLSQIQPLASREKGAVAILKSSGDIVPSAGGAFAGSFNVFRRFAPTYSPTLAAVSEEMISSKKGSMAFEFGGEKYIAFFGPIEHRGWSALCYVSLDEFVKPVRQLTVFGIWIGIAVALLSLLLSIRPVWTATRAIGRMNQFCTRVGQGDISARPDVNRQDEFGVLAQTMASMAQQIETTVTDLRESGEELRVYRDRLEELVRERTAELVSANGLLRQEVAERKQAVARAQEMAQAAQAAAEAKSRFLANMSHEIRTPMNGILGMTELALDTDLTAEQERYLEGVNDSGEALLAIINDILDFSKVEAGKLELVPGDFQLRHLVYSAVRPLAVRADQKGLELLLRVRPNVPDTLVGDGGRLRQILANLVGNAVKFTETGEILVEVDLHRPSSREPVLYVKVRDSGIGIPKEKQDAVFEAFEQADGSTTRRYGGTGLGLAICQRLVHLMGGRIWLESEQGRGSTFHFTVRLGVRTPGQDSPAQESEPVDLAGMDVLVVDDNATNRIILGEFLAGWSMVPTLVPSAPAAIKAMKRAHQARRPFRLAITDVHMPRMDGFDLAEAIRQDADVSGTPILMLTSAGHRGDSARCQKLGITTCLTKPICRDDLLEGILQAIGASPASRPGEPHHPKPARSPARKLRILLAEDNLINQRLGVSLLEKRGHVVVVACNGLEALEALEQEPFDVVLMDVQMPEMNGIEATAAIRQAERTGRGHMHIIAMTAHAMKGDRERCIEVGMDDYVAKPIRREELLAALRRVPVAAPADAVGSAAP